jgi:hypothetical protein
MKAGPFFVSVDIRHRGRRAATCIYEISQVRKNVGHAESTAIDETAGIGEAVPGGSMDDLDAYAKTILTEFEPFVREDLERRISGGTDEGLRKISPELAFLVVDAWSTALGTAAEEHGGTLDTALLDDSMLPQGLADEDLMAPDGEEEEAEEIRSLLARYKVSLPQGARLPEWLVKILVEGGMTVI